MRLPANLAEGTSVPTLPGKCLSVTLAPNRLCRHVSSVCSLQFCTLCSLAGALWPCRPPGHLWSCGAPCRAWKGPAVSCIHVSGKLFLLVSLENTFQNSSEALFPFLALQGKLNHFFDYAHMLLCSFVITLQQSISLNGNGIEEHTPEPAVFPSSCFFWKCRGNSPTSVYVKVYVLWLGGKYNHSTVQRMWK